MKTTKEKLKALWEKACKYDAITPESKFVVFSDGNPHIKKYNTMMDKFVKEGYK